MIFAALIVTPVTASASDMAPGVRGEIQVSMNDAGDKLIELAGATPQAKYTWRPAKDVRSTSEVFLHVVQANYIIPMFMGIKPPLSMEELRAIDKSTTDKAKIAKTLKDSYAFANQAILGMSEADLDAEMDFFGKKMTKRAGLMVLASHSHEHLGQAIAYSRMNGVTPPWTAREKAEAAKKAAEKKAGGGH
ncbi:MAG: DinB family protein [Candidatus Eisenbacteria bacterium]